LSSLNKLGNLKELMQGVQNKLYLKELKNCFRFKEMIKKMIKKLIKKLKQLKELK
jgi:hypothetical protein